MSALGDLLKERRQEHQWTLQEVAQQTRIRQDFLEALEEGRYDRLPADVQVRGFLRTYANVLGLKPQDVLALYRQERGEPELVSIAPLSRPPRARSCALPSLGFAIVSFFIVATVSAIVYFGWLNSPPSTLPPTATLAPPTPTNILPTATPTIRILLDTPTPTAPSTKSPHSYDGVIAILELTSDCWVRVEADGVEIFQGTLAAGTTRTFNADQQLTIRFGNAGGVRVTLNGEELGVQGALGQVVTRTWTAEE